VTHQNPATEPGFLLPEEGLKSPGQAPGFLFQQETQLQPGQTSWFGLESRHIYQKN